MPSVVIIHAAEDTLPARALAEKLRPARLTVVLEKPAGEELRTAAKGAQVCVALWSPRSVTQAQLVEDAAFAAGKSKIVHVTMQSAQVPEQFRREKSVNLTGWRGQDDFPAWREVSKLITDKAGIAPLPPPAPKPPSGFFQPGRVAEGSAAPGQTQQRAKSAPRPAAPQQRAAPAPRAPQQQAQAAAEPKSGGNGLMIGIAALVAVAVLGGGGYYVWSQSQGAQTTSAEWEELERTDATALRAFIEGAPGDYRDDALAALAELEERTFEAASDADSIEALEAFLSDFPESEHAIAARGRIAELEAQPAPPAEAPIELAPPEPTATDIPPATEPEPAPGPAALTPPAPEPAPPSN